MKVAINHPYFFPYAGFFRLMAAADVFVALDTAQFPRRGYVHRNKLIDREGSACWITLPLRKQPRDVRIRDIAFAEDAGERLRRQRRRFPAMTSPRFGINVWIDDMLLLNQPPAALIASALCWVNQLLGYDTPIIWASELDIDHSLVGEDRIIAILEYLGADVYINAPNGRHLYSDERFARHCIEKRFLAHYAGDHISILQRLTSESCLAIRQELELQITWQP